MRGLAWRLLLAGSALLTAPAAAAAADDPPHGWRWNVDYGDQRCSLIRLDEPAQSMILAVQTIPGSANYHLRLIARRWPSGVLGNPDGVRISLQPDGANLEGARRVQHTPSGQALVAYLRANPLDTLAESRSLRIERRGETVMEIPLADTAEAVAAFRRCTHDVLREWGVDPAVYARAREGLRPLQPIASVVTDRDYPIEAIRGNRSGEVVVRLTVDTNGRVSECVPVVSSGHEILDNRACEIYRARLRFSPAIGMDGAPMAMPLVVNLRWILPDD